MTRTLVVLALLLLACSKTKSNELPPESWSTTDYQAAGLDAGKAWSPADFTRAATVLKGEVDAGKRDHLPRYHGAKSGAVFDKLLADFADADQPVTERYIARATRVEALNTISQQYLPNQMATPPREYVEIIGALMRDAATLMQLSEPFMATFPPDDPSRQARLDGLAKAKDGFGTMLLGGLLMGGDKRLPDADRVAMLQHVKANLSALLPLAPAHTQRDFRDQLAMLLDRTDGNVHAELVAIKAALP